MAYKYTQEQLDKDYKEFIDEKEQMIERVKQIEIIHEFSVIINRIDISKIKTFLNLDTKADKQRVRESWMGEVIKVSSIDSGDEVHETQKKKLNQWDVVIFNPDSAYSLNLEGFYNIWTIDIKNVLFVDRGFNYDQRYKELLEKKLQTFG